MFKNILLPVDLAEIDGPDKALSTAVGLCKTNGATLHAVSVMPGFGMSMVSQFFPEDFEEKAQAAAAKNLKDFIAKKVPSDISCQTIVASGTIYEEILRFAKEVGCDLIVMAAHKPDLKDYLLGPNAARVVRHANCSVFVIRE